MDDNIKKAAKIWVEEIIVPMHRITAKAAIELIFKWLIEKIDKENITVITIGGKRFIREDTIDRKDVD